MADFFRTNAYSNDSFIRGAARLMWAGTTIAFPTTIGDIINLSTYDAATGWNDLGATKTGITITHNNTEETFDVDQILTDIETRPVSYEQSVATALAEMTLDRLQIAWQAGTKTTSGSEESMGVGEPATYIRRRLAVLFQKADGKIRAHVYRLVIKGANESSLVYAKTGEQLQIPVTFKALADTSITDVNTRTQVIFNQI
jgi:hypothetical protein